MGELLHLASRRKHAEVVELLLERGNAPLGAVEARSWSTPLFVAASRDDARVIEILLNHGAQINAIDNPRHGRTALSIAMARGCIGAATALLEHGADMTLRGLVPYRVLDIAIQSDRSASTIPLLLAYGAQINARACSGRRVLHYAAERGQLEVIEVLAAHGADMNP